MKTERKAYSPVFKLTALTLVLVFMLSGCSLFRSKPEETVKAFETAYNDLDLQGLKDCIDPDLVSAAQSGIGAVGSIVGIDLSSMLDLMITADSLGLLDEAKAMDREPLGLEVTDSQIDGDNAVLTVNAVYEGETVESTFDMVYKDGHWYISSIQ